MDLELRISTLFSAPRAKVWRALTDPSLIKKYMFGTDTRTSWNIGSPITFSGVWEGKPYEDKGKILAMEKEKMLAYNYWSAFSGKEDVPENYSRISYELEERKGGTLFTLVQDNFGSTEAKEHSEKNWKGIFESMKKVLEEM